MKIQKRTPAVNLNNTRKSRLSIIAMNSPLESEETETQGKQVSESIHFLAFLLLQMRVTSSHIIAWFVKMHFKIFAMKYILMIIICHYKQTAYTWWAHRAEPEMFMCTRFSGWLNGINIMPFLSLTPAEKLTAFFRPQSNLQYRKLNWRNTYVWGSCWFMPSTENPCLQRTMLINNILGAS